MVNETVVVYVLSLSTLLIALICLGVYLSWTASQADGFVWKVKGQSSPLWYICNGAFLYSGLLSDVAFIRAAVVIGMIFLTAWVSFGCASWPNLWYSEVAGINVQQIIVCSLTLLINGVPMFRQLNFDDSKVTFAVKKRYVDAAELIWREWWRRSGIPRVDFKAILESGQFAEVAAGHPLEIMASASADETDISPRDSLMRTEDGDLYLDVFYYIVHGRVLVTPHAASGQKEFMIGAGSFLDAFVLMSLLGQTSVGLAMQSGPNKAVVVEDALLIKWPVSAMKKLRFRFDTFIPQCLRTIVSAATLDNLYFCHVKEEKEHVFKAVEATRLDMMRSHLPKEAANIMRPWWKQFLMSHTSIRDLWQPSPHQRVVNSIQTGSREMVFLQEIKRSKQALACMRRAASGEHFPASCQSDTGTSDGDTSTQDE